MAELEVGNTLPPFHLPRDGGGFLDSASLAGKPFVLYVYPKDNTEGCTLEAVDFSSLNKDFAKLGVAIVGLSPDNARSHDRFKAKHGLKLDLVSDENREVLESLGLWVEKSLYGRKYMGVERATVLVGADGRIARVWRKVRVRGHAAEVLEAAKAL
ncbi:MAG: peroxiredoxin [Mesorhizobium sp.]|nr:peroxiredoxin [Mesorhizobium sp.]